MFKEFILSFCKEVFDKDQGLWLANKNNEFYPNPDSSTGRESCCYGRLSSIAHSRRE